MRLIDEFQKEVLVNEGSFVLQMDRDGREGKRTYYFMQGKVGKARYVYGSYDYWDEHFYSGIGNKPELVAIVADGIVYIVNIFYFNVLKYNGEVLPNGCVELSDLIKEKNRYVNNVAFPQFYDTLETVPVEDEGRLRYCKKQARTKLLYGSCESEHPQFEESFRSNDIAKMLCGFIDLEKCIEEEFSKEKEDWVRYKSEQAKIKELLSDSSVAEEWEIVMAKGIRSVDARTVTVTFSFNNKEASAKIEPGKIIHILKEKDYFSGFNFATSKQGYELIECLCAVDGRRSNENLRCEHISKITYGKKVLYEKIS